MIAHPEPMSPAMTKFHIDAPAVLHRFTAPDVGDFHDHPWPFSSQVLSGGYVEEVLDLDTLGTSMVLRQPGDVFEITAQHVHRIVRLLDGDCWTAIRPGPWERKSGFWRVRGGRAEFRTWDAEWA